MYNKSSSKTRSGNYMIIYVDIDGTICYTENSDYENSIPNFIHILKINKLYDEGHEIVYWTARGGTTGKSWRTFTKKQIDNWGCKYHHVSVGEKPLYDLVIDDKAKRIEEL